MLPSSFAFVGIDPTAGRHPFTYAALDKDCQLVALAAGDMDEVLDFVAGQPAVVAAVNAPPRPNLGLVRKRLDGQGVTSGYLRGSDIRQAEDELRSHGISISPTPSHAESCPAWMQMGFELYCRFGDYGFKCYPTEGASHQWLETHPHAAFCALLGQTPLPKPTLEGRLQRQAVLHERGVGLEDPMVFFEEITRHKLLLGALPLDWIYTAEELDTLVAAYTAYCALNCPQEVTMIGDQVEGRIALPVAGLKESYS